jgi:phosphoribosylglycinamide formyltransferase-1
MSFETEEASRRISIAIMGSGSGSNAAAIIAYFKNKPGVKVALVLSDQPNAGILDVATSNHIPSLVLHPEDRKNPQYLLEVCNQHHIELIALAGYLKKLNPIFLRLYTGIVLNIHPALLPAFGGKGMYGIQVHEAVISSGSKVSGITIHYVNGEYDAGAILFQKSEKIEAGCDAFGLSKQILKLEHQYYPEIIASECKKISSTD